MVAINYNSNSNMLTLAFVLLFTLLGLQGVRGGLSGAIKCEELPVEMCAFSVSTTGIRCVLEKSVKKDGASQFQCQSSVVKAEKVREWIESEECLNACGLERMSVGISSDSLFEEDFTRRLCSPSCRNSCPNILDLHHNLAAAEGINWESLCRAQQSRSRREMAEVLSSAKSNGVTAEFLVHRQKAGQSTGRFGRVKGTLAALANATADAPAADTPPAFAPANDPPADGPSSQTPPAFAPSSGPPADGPAAQTPPALSPSNGPVAFAPFIISGGAPGYAPPANGPAAEGPPAEGPAAEGPAAEGPPAEGPPAEGPAAEGPATSV